MAQGIYAGIGGAARKVTGVYAGIDGAARKVAKAYVGVDGLARLAWQAVQPITLANLIANGSFEADTGGWTASGGTFSRVAVPAPVHGEAGNWCGQVSQAVNGAIYLTSGGFTAVSGHRYYLRAQVRYTTANYAQNVQLYNAGTALSPALSLANAAVNSWALLDGLWTANSSSLALRVQWSGSSGNQTRTGQLDNVMAIDLTACCGAGKEPDQAAMRGIVSGLGGYWDGAAQI